MVVAVASPSSAPAAAGGATVRPHPTYREMIVQAVTELREPSGSSRRAIAKYIADHFSALPVRHDALLPVHLRRLRSQGVLVMSGYSYLLSSSVPQQRRGRGRPPKNSPAALARSRPAALAVEPPPPGVKRGPGRPRKAAVSAVPVTVLGVKRGRGRPPKNATPVVAAAPLAAKRGPGRPRKIATPVASAAVLGAKRGRGRPPKKVAGMAGAPGARRKPGRPRKIAVVVNTVQSGKRLPGRPRKSVVVLDAVQGSSGDTAVNAGVVGARLGRGRPRKATLPSRHVAAAVALPSSVGGKRKRGRPPKEKRMPGRPRKDKPLQPGPVVAGDAKTAKKKRGPGRPRKEKPLEVVPAEAGGPVEGEMIEAEPVQGGHEVGPVEDRVAGLMEKRGRGRPRKGKLSVTRPAKAGVAAAGEKRGRGRPRKEKPLETGTLEAGVAESVEKRGRGRPRKEKPLEVGSAEAGGVVLGEFNEVAVRPVEGLGLVSGEKTEDGGPELGNKMESVPVDAGGVVSWEKVESVPVDAGGVVSVEKAAAGPVEAGGLVSGEKTVVEPIEANPGPRNL